MPPHEPHEAAPRPAASSAAAPPPGAAPAPWRVARRLLGLLASVAISAAILVLLWRWRHLDLGRSLAAWRGADKLLIVIVLLGSAAVSILVAAHKQALLLRAMGIDVGFGEMVRVRLGTGPLRLLLPLGAGDYVPIAYYWRHRRMPLGHASGALVFDKGLNLLGAAVWLALGFAVLPGAGAAGGDAAHAAPWRWAPLGAVVLLYGLVFFVPRGFAFGVAVARRAHLRAGALAAGLAAPFVELPVRRKLLLIAYGIGYQLRPLLACLGLLAAHHLAVGLEPVMAYGSVAVFAGFTPGVAAGMGPREVAVVETFSRLGASPDALFSVGLLLSLTQQVFPMLLGLPWLPWFVRRLRRREDLEARAA